MSNRSELLYEDEHSLSGTFRENLLYYLLSRLGESASGYPLERRRHVGHVLHASMELDKARPGSRCPIDRWEFRLLVIHPVLTPRRPPFIPQSLLDQPIEVGGDDRPNASGSHQLRQKPVVGIGLAGVVDAYQLLECGGLDGPEILHEPLERAIGVEDRRLVFLRDRKLPEYIFLELEDDRKTGVARDARAAKDGEVAVLDALNDGVD